MDLKILLGFIWELNLKLERGRSTMGRNRVSGGL